MTRYFYKARNNEGELVTGDLDGDSEQEVISQLHQMEYTPVKVSQEVPKLNIAPELKIGSFGSPRVKIRDLMMFCTNLSSMVSAGIPLINALQVTGEQLTNAKLRDTVGKIKQMVSDGSSFSEALGAFPDVFSSFFINMVRAGEMSGTLDKVLKEMTVYLERQDTLIQTVRGMLIYPIVLLVACISVVVLIITFVMPQFVEIFNKAKVPLPLPTKVLYGIGIWIKLYPLYYCPALVILFLGIKVFLKTDQGKVFFDHFVLKVPLIGSLINKTLLARFCRTLSTLLETGVPMLQGLRILQQVLGNVVYVGIIDEVYNSVEKGEGINKALMLRREFPKDVTYMISVGEMSGNIATMLNKVADFYENKVQLQVKELMALIEPSFVVFIGGVVGVIMASIILPMFDMVQTIKQ